MEQVNPILQMLSSRDQIRNLIALSKCKNPQQIVNFILQKNPVLQQSLSQGISPKDAFYELASRKGIDPNQILKLLKEDK